MSNHYKNKNNVARELVKLILGKAHLGKPAMAVDMDNAGNVKFCGPDGTVHATAILPAEYARKILNALGNDHGLPGVIGGFFTPDGRATFVMGLDHDMRGAAA